LRSICELIHAVDSVRNESGYGIIGMFGMFGMTQMTVRTDVFGNRIPVRICLILT
jgi:hypothetical protein